MKTLVKITGILSILLLFHTVGFAQTSGDWITQKDIKEIPSPLAAINKLEPLTFEYDQANYKVSQVPKGRQYGFKDEDIQAIFPDMVKYTTYQYPFGKNSYRTVKMKTVEMEGLIPVLVASIQEQQKEIEKLKTDIEQLKQQMQKR